uniref:Endonuclease/exonuclease/phosphatase domain-containing protein n=1 Tax=Periophthalmus magnuspinnatus TaxID=409849 RepID=A0A3B4AT39_9GOBI
MTASVNICTWNTKGLNAPVKRPASLGHLLRHSFDIAFIQEYHLQKADLNRVSNQYYYTAVSSLLESKTCGTLVVIKRNLNVTITDSYGSSDGHIAYIKESFRTRLCENKINFIRITRICGQLVWACLLPHSSEGTQGTGEGNSTGSQTSDSGGAVWFLSQS